MFTNSINIKKLANDDVFVPNKCISVEEAFKGITFRTGLDKAVISNGKVVNIVSNKYGHLPNTEFFTKAEQALQKAGVNYDTRSINRDDRSFTVDYILNDENFVVNIKNGMDKIKPMLRFTNSYDGSCKTAGHFGFFREVCSNGLHTTESKINFSLRHRGAIVEFVMPEIKELMTKFFDNDFYTIKRKFEVLAEKPLTQTELKDFVKYTLGKTGLWMYEKSEKNPEPSLNSQMVLDTVNREANLLGTEPNMWLGYNAMNEVLHGKLKKTFEQQRNLDVKLFDVVAEMAMAN